MRIEHCTHTHTHVHTYIPLSIERMRLTQVGLPVQRGINEITREVNQERELGTPGNPGWKQAQERTGKHRYAYIHIHTKSYTPHIHMHIITHMQEHTH